MHHRSENLGKATGVHAKVLFPNDVTIYHFPEMPDFDFDSTVLLFPSKEATPIYELTIEEISQIKHAVFIDSTWQSARSIWSSPVVSKLRKVRIVDRVTRFWRYQSLGPSCLATIEAIYYLCRELIEKQRLYLGEVDDLLFLFSYMYHTIQDSYRKSGKEFKHIQGYIQKLESPAE